MTTRVGELTLRVPRDRDGEFSTELFERFQRNERALVVTLMEIVTNGVSTRRVKNITDELCGRQFSKSTVSRLAQNIDELVDKWCNRPLDRHRYPVVLIDAMQIKVRRNGAVRPTSALIAVGINEEGMREILGVQIANSESEQSWQDYFDWLKDRGLTGVEVVVSDAHSGLVSALHRCFQGARWQRCQVHLKRNLKDKVPASCWEEFNEALDEVFKADDRAEARRAFNDLAAQFEDRAGRAVQLLEGTLEDAICMLAFPGKYRRHLRTTNMIERLIREVRRREKVISIFPNDQSAWRLIGAYLMEQHEEWSTGRKYLDMTDFYRAISQGGGSDDAMNVAAE